MAKKLWLGVQINSRSPAGKANPCPVGPRPRSQRGINIHGILARFNANDAQGP